MNTGDESLMDLPKSNVLIYHTEDGTKVCVPDPVGLNLKSNFTLV